MSLVKDTGACALDGVTLLVKLTADRQMKHANTSLLVKSSSYCNDGSGNRIEAELQRDQIETA